MLATTKVVAFLATTDAARARAFFEGVLGLRLTEDSPFALVFDAGGTMLRVQRVKNLTPHPFTALGWEVDDVGARARALTAAGVELLRIGGMDQDADGVWSAPGGAKVAWFKDPDGNTLSLSQHPR